MKLKVDIEKKLGDFILKSSFETGEGTFAILGASGSGKTQTLKCICGIEKPDKGRIVLGDSVLFDSQKGINIPARNREIGYLFQDNALFPNMTAEENIFLVAKDKEYAQSLISKFDIGPIRKLRPEKLSGGQKRRVAIARMLATKPKALLLDEPFTSLDNHLRTRTEHEILDITDEFDGPVVLVSHDRNEVYRLSSDIGVMERGTLIETQSRQEFFDNPKSVVAARLTGCKNISKIEKLGKGRYRAIDWGINLKTDDIENIKYIGYRAHYFEKLSKTESENFKRDNILCCTVKRIIEDTFSMVICFENALEKSESPDALMTWIVSKEYYKEIEDEILSGFFYLGIDSEKLILLER